MHINRLSKQSKSNYPHLSAYSWIALKRSDSQVHERSSTPRLARASLRLPRKRGLKGRQLEADVETEVEVILGDGAPAAPAASTAVASDLFLLGFTQPGGLGLFLLPLGRPLLGDWTCAEGEANVEAADEA